MEQHHLVKMIENEDLLKKIKELGKKISEDYEDKDIYCICILKGASVFMSELIQHIDNENLYIDFMSVSSYSSGTETSGIVKILKDIDKSIEDKNVIIVEDILDTGTTLFHLREMLGARHPKSLKICTLLDKPERRVKGIEADYKCFTIEDKFVVGFGLDYDEKYRQLPFIAEVVFE